MSLLSTLYISSSLLVLGLGLLVYQRRQQAKDRLVFSAFCLTIFGWLFCYGLMQFPDLHPLFWARLGHSSVIFVPITYLHFVVHFLRLPKLRRLVHLYYAIGVVSLVFMHTTDLYVPSVKAHAWGISPMGGIVMRVDFLILVAAAALCWILFVIRCRQTHRQGSVEAYNRLKYGSIAMTIFSLSLVDFFPKLLDVSFYPLGFATTTIFVLITTYAILKQQLLDLNIAIRKSLIYSVLVTALTVGYFGLVYLIEWLFRATFGYHSVWLSLSAFALMALFFQPLKIGVQRVVDWLFFRAPHEEVVRRMERLEREVRQSDKLKAVSTLAAGMAHEIKNPLTAIKTFATYLPEKGTDPEFQRKFQRIVTKEVDKIDRIVRELLNFAKPSKPELQPMEVSRLLDETLDFLSSETLKRRVEVMRAYTPDGTIHADPQQLRQVFLNLFLNSLDAMDGAGGRLTVSTRRDNAHLSVEIRDTGCGIPREQLNHIFDPFFTTKEGGTGLGLSVVQGIIREHGGRIRLDSHPGLGTIVTIELPLPMTDR